MNDDDIPAKKADDPSATDATETAVDGGAVATEAPQSRFWGAVPSGWELVEGSEVYDVNPSYTPDEEEVTYIEMDALDTELPFPKYSKKRNASDYSGKLFREGDTLFARITPCTENGKAAFVDEIETDVGIGSTEYAVLSPDRERIHPLYLYYVAKSHPVRNYAISRMRGSTGRQRVPFDVFRREVDISLPPMEEQVKIGSILLNIDQGILKTKEVISKTERVKQGIEQDLFQSGYNEHDSIEERRLIKMPTDWDFDQLSDHVVDSAFGPRYDSEKYDENGNIATLRTTDLDKYGRISHETMPKANLSMEKFEDHLLEEGDLVISRSGANAGLATTWHGNGVPTIPGAYMIRFRTKETLNGEFLHYYINSSVGSKRIQRRARGSGQKNLAGSELLNMRFPAPSIDEQSKITGTLRDVLSTIDVQQEYIEHLKRIKTGVMQDLLTGNLRTCNRDIPGFQKTVDD